MPVELLAAGIAAALLLGIVNIVLLLRTPGGLARLALAHRTEADSVRSTLASTERALTTRAEQSRLESHALLGALATQMAKEQGDQRTLLETKLREMGEQSALKLSDIQRSVNERLAEAVEKQMQGSFQRVIDQFTLVQKAMGDVQAITAQIGDLKRVFSNVKTRGAWGEMHLRALLEDVLPHGAWEANRKLSDQSGEVVEFALLMPSKAIPRPLLALDAKFPAEDYDRLVLAAEAGDAEGERLARRGLESRLRLEARKIAAKYIVQPTTVDFAVMYLPTDGLYVEAARMPGLIESLNRDHHVLLMGPTLLPALLRTIQLGALSLSIEQRAGEIKSLLGAVRTEFTKMDGVLARLERNAGAITNTIGDARRRTRAMERTLRNVESMAGEDAAAALQLESVLLDDDDA